MKTYTVPSNSGGAPYTVTVADDGRLSCASTARGGVCRGFIFKKLNAPRFCSHCRTAVADNGLVTERRGDYMAVVNLNAPASTAAPTPTAATPASAPTLASALPPKPMLASAMPDSCKAADGGPHWPAILKLYANANYAMTEKFDGHRLTVETGPTVVGWSRPGAGKVALRRTLPPHLMTDLATLPPVLLDGELIVPGGRAPDVVNTLNANKLVYVVFDILRVGTHSTTALPASERRALLTELFSRHLTSDAVRLAPSMPVTRTAIEAIWARDGEGAIIARLNAPYACGTRSDAWVKVKACRTTVLTITGYEAGKCGPHSKVILTDAAGRLTTVKTLNNLWLTRFAANPTTYLGAKLRIEYHELTATGAIRHGRWDRLESE